MSDDELPDPALLNDDGVVRLVELAQLEAMFRMLIDSGDMTPMAAMQLRKLFRSGP